MLIPALEGVIVEIGECNVLDGKRIKSEIITVDRLTILQDD
jgi:hypothetical protein